jgi:plastocyanin
MHSLRNPLSIAVFALLVVALVYACGGSNASPSAPSPAPPAGGGASNPADVTITIVGMNGSQSYSPDPAVVKVGQTVAWRNADDVAHTATGNAGTFNTGNIASGATSAPITMTAAGAVGYHCALHPSMVGSLTVQ